MPGARLTLYFRDMKKRSDNQVGKMPSLVPEVPVIPNNKSQI
jgi:hypothetical protein